MTAMLQSISRLSALRGCWLAPATIVVLALLLAQAGAQVFNCRAAYYGDEHMICRQPGLARLDAQLTDLYLHDLANLPPDQRMQFQQHEILFVQARRRCGEDVGCIAQSYRNRIRELQQMLAIAKKEDDEDQSIGAREAHSRPAQRTPVEVSHASIGGEERSAPSSAADRGSDARAATAPRPGLQAKRHHGKALSDTDTAGGAAPVDSTGAPSSAAQPATTAVPVKPTINWVNPAPTQ